MFQPTPRFVSEANPGVRPWLRVGVEFQPTPRFVSEANDSDGGVPAARSMFQPTPRFVSEANGYGAAAGSYGWVSTHAPLRQRGEHEHAISRRDAHALFQPTPRFVSEANGPGIRFSVRCDLFQPTPRFVSEANQGPAFRLAARQVSTHAPLRQRGERYACPSRDRT